MSIRFKFRSTIAVESVDLNGRPLISVGDLRTKIIAHRNLQGHDFDLIISDADTDIVFKDDNTEVKEGSTVIVRRVPANRSSISRDLRDAVNVGRSSGGHQERVKIPPSNNVDMKNFEDFSVDLHAPLNGSLPKKNVDQRCSGTSIIRNQNRTRRPLEAMLKEGIGDNYCKEPRTTEIEKDIKSDGHKKSDEYVCMPSRNLSKEFWCSLCNEDLKEAVMVRCCYSNFCEKCVRSVLAATSSCPKCLSIEYTIEDLIPNLTLRDMIKRLLDEQAASKAPHIDIPQFVPDGESVIHSIEVPCAVSIQKKELPCPHSPSTGERSNQVTRQFSFGNEEDTAFAGGMPAYPQAYWHGALYAHNWPYADKPGASGIMPFHQPMIPSPYDISPYMTCMYASMPHPYGFMTMGGVQSPLMTGVEQPYHNFPYMTCMYACMPHPYGYMVMGGVQPPLTTGVEQPCTHRAFMDPQASERMYNSVDDHPDRCGKRKRDNVSEDYYYKGTRRVSHQERHKLDEEVTERNGHGHFDLSQDGLDDDYREQCRYHKRKRTR